jgi:hypothetical protein
MCRTYRERFEHADMPNAYAPDIWYEMYEHSDANDTNFEVRRNSVGMT